MRIPALSIAFMAVSAIISFGLPVALLILFCRKYHAKLIPALAGAAVFVLFALVLEQTLHSFVLRAGSPVAASVPLYVLYGTLASGVFEETGRLLAFLLLRRRYSGAQNALSYGAGHGGIEAMLLSGLTMISNISLGIMLNSGAASAFLDAGTPLREISMTLASVPPTDYLLSGIERIGAVTLHIALSVIVWYAVSQKGRLWLFPLAILLHAVSNLSAALYSAGMITNLLLVEVLIYLPAAAAAALAVLIHRKYRTADSAPAEMPQAGADCGAV